MNEQINKSLIVALVAAVFVSLVVAVAGASVTGISTGSALVIGLVAGVLAFLINHFLVALPLGRGIAYVHGMVASNGAAAADLAAPRSGAAAPTAELVEAYFSKHAKLAEHVAEIGGSMATAAAEVSFASDQLRTRVNSQVAHANEIANATGMISSTVQAAVDSSGRAVETAKQARRASYIGQEMIQEATQQMEQMRARVEEAANLMAHLEGRADQIRQITGVINEIADQTNLLALNAAIEAARAGDQGRGFAVVAEEVRNLAKRTTAATTEIGQMVQEINEETRNAATTMHDVVEAVAQSSQQTEKVNKQFEEVLDHARAVEQQINEIAEGSEQNHQHLQQISDSVQTITSDLSETEADVESVAKQALQVSDRAEALFESLGEISLGPVHDDVCRLATRAARQIGEIFEQAVASGRIGIDDLFDRNYQPIEGTNPQKFKTRFDDFTDEVLPPIQEALLAENSAIAFAAAVDENGYLPTHNRKFAQPLTGDYDTDLVNNRTKRIFDDRTGARCGSHTRPFLLQTYKRDTGEVMHDLSVPIFVNGRHWGGFRVGYRSD
ncbi:MAG: methyl-accepting chemotaxis protein [Gammaproteobacteria bacterium]